MFSQSGSFFQVRHDDDESGYRYFGRISRLVQSVLDMRHAEHPLIVGMTCGALEENVANNRDMAAALRRAGHDVTLREVARPAQLHGLARRPRPGTHRGAAHASGATR